MNFKKIILGSVLATAFSAFLACGPDNGSSADIPDDVPGGEVKIPKESALSPIVVNGLKITVMSGADGMRGSLGGVIKLDPDFIDSTEAYTANVRTTIDSVSFVVGRTGERQP